jgi:hypothetical protein
MRQRFKQTLSLKDRLVSFSAEIREEADLLPPGGDRDDMRKKARQAKTAAHIEDWANSSGLQPPK